MLLPQVLRDERIVVVAEQRPDCSEEESFQWMSRVLQAVDSIHQAGIFCLALVPPGYLPKTPLGGIHTAETRRRFLEGSLHPANILMCPHACVTNLPKPREPQPVGPASVLVGSIVQGKTHPIHATHCQIYIEIRRIFSILAYTPNYGPNVFLNTVNSFSISMYRGVVCLLFIVTRRRSVSLCQWPRTGSSIGLFVC